MKIVLLTMLVAFVTYGISHESRLPPASCYEFGGASGLFPMPCAPQTPDFQRGVITSLMWVKDAGGTNVGISFSVELRDSTTTETFSCAYEISGAEFAALPAGAAAKRAAVLAIIKREARTTYQAWKASLAARRQPPTPRDPLTDLGTSEILDFTGAAAPTPTPTPTP